MVGVAEGDVMPDAFAVVHIFALTVFKLAQSTLAVKLSHLFGSAHIAIVLCVEILLACSFNSFDKLNSLLKKYIKLATECKKPVYLCNRAGGIIPSPEEVLAAIVKANENGGDL